jgi:hypothetical protein
MTIPGGSVVGRSCDKDELGKNYEKKTMNTTGFRLIDIRNLK